MVLFRTLELKEERLLLSCRLRRTKYGLTKEARKMHARHSTKCQRSEEDDVEDEKSDGEQTEDEDDFGDEESVENRTEEGVKTFRNEKNVSPLDVDKGMGQIEVEIEDNRKSRVGENDKVVPTSVDVAFTAPKIDNSKCETAPGCGEWKRPTKLNLAYKGKWQAPLIDNPNYKGLWKSQEIPNPNYFELDKPDFEPIAAIGIEIWTMQDGILFDNILIASNEKVAESYRDKAWKPKFEVEKEKQKEEDASAGQPDGIKGFKKVVFDFLYEIADIPFLTKHKGKILDLIEQAEKQPNLTIGVLLFPSLLLPSQFYSRSFLVGRNHPNPNAGFAQGVASNEGGGFGGAGLGQSVVCISWVQFQCS
ncbi:hypothetical protein U1Q18_005853 [Sarracenia purpurea var. burkii]